MDFSYTETQQMLQDQLQKFVQKSYDFETRKKIIASDTGFDVANWQLFAELGWLAVPFSEEDGGLGGSAVDLIVMMEEFGKANLVEPFLPTAVIAGRLIANLAESPRKEELLEQLIGGQLQLACAISETGSRYNLARVQTSARADGDQFILNGSKIAVLNAGNADQLLVVARESGEPGDREGISLFMVDPGTAGVRLQVYPTIDGKRAAEIEFKDVKVPAANRLGAAGQAYAALESVVELATIGVCAEAVGALEALLRKTVEYTKTRKQFGVPIATFQALQHRMADMFIECQLARSILIMAAMKYDSDADLTEKLQAVSAAKSRVGKAIRHVGEEAVQLHGGIGTTEELDVGHLFKRVTALEILFGDTDYHLDRFTALQ